MDMQRFAVLDCLARLRFVCGVLKKGSNGFDGDGDATGQEVDGSAQFVTACGCYKQLVVCSFLDSPTLCVLLRFDALLTFRNCKLMLQLRFKLKATARVQRRTYVLREHSASESFLSAGFFKPSRATFSTLCVRARPNSARMRSYRNSSIANSKGASRALQNCCAVAAATMSLAGGRQSVAGGPMPEQDWR